MSLLAFGRTLATTGLFGWTGYVGGEIRHPGSVRRAASRRRRPPHSACRDWVSL